LEEAVIRAAVPIVLIQPRIKSFTITHLNVTKCFRALIPTAAACNNAGLPPPKKFREKELTQMRGIRGR
jgi:hypothetical protein